MKHSHRLVTLAVVSVLVLSGCKSDPGGTVDSAGASADEPTTTTTTLLQGPPVAPDALDISFTEAPFAYDGDVSFVSDLRCGPAERNLVDVAVPRSVDEIEAARSEGSADLPLVVHIHGGGFIGGDKAEVWTEDAEEITTYLANGVAVASLNYTLLASAADGGVKTSMGDAAACLQFLRYNGSATFGIDPDLVVLHGGSAGAGTSLWLATHDDLADPTSSDPIEQQSTKPIAVAVVETQATYDLDRWGTDVFGDYTELFANQTLVQLAEAFGLADRLLSFYGISDSSQLATPEIEAYRADVDILALMDPNDPPAWVRNTREEEVLPVSVGLLFHHGYHARALQRQAEAVGYEAEVTWGFHAEPATSETDFVLRAIDEAR